MLLRRPWPQRGSVVWNEHSKMSYWALKDSLLVRVTVKVNEKSINWWLITHRSVMHQSARDWRFLGARKGLDLELATLAFVCLPVSWSCNDVYAGSKAVVTRGISESTAERPKARALNLHCGVRYGNNHIHLPKSWHYKFGVGQGSLRNISEFKWASPKAASLYSSNGPT